MYIGPPYSSEPATVASHDRGVVMGSRLPAEGRGSAERFSVREQTWREDGHNSSHSYASSGTQTECY